VLVGEVRASGTVRQGDSDKRGVVVHWKPTKDGGAEFAERHVTREPVAELVVFLY